MAAIAVQRANIRRFFGRLDRQFTGCSGSLNGRRSASVELKVEQAEIRRLAEDRKGNALYELPLPRFLPARPRKPVN